MKKLIWFNLCIFMLVTSTSSDCSFQIREYQPTSENEKVFYNLSNKNISPREIEKNIDFYKDTEIGWVGILRGYAPLPWNKSVEFLVEHRYYNWIENMMLDKIKMPISSNGNGEFFFQYQTDNIEEVVLKFENDLIQYVIVYGKPYEFVYTTDLDGVEYKSIYINADYIKFIANDSVVHFGE